MRACFGGNRELALKLYNRNPKVLQMNNIQGENCLAIAKSSGHHDIATVLECLEAARILESKNDSYLTITPQDEKQFLKPFEIKKSSRTKSLDEYRNRYVFVRKCLFYQIFDMLCKMFSMAHKINFMVRKILFTV